MFTSRLCFKTRLWSPSRFYIWGGNRFPFPFFQFSGTNLGANKYETSYYSYGPYCLVSCLQSVEVLGIDFPTVQEVLKLCVAMPFLIIN
jgi:hypothetical protein